MKTFLECTDLAAREVGDTGFKNWLNFKLDAEQLEHLQRAADIYASQSNSHKHSVMQGLPTDEEIRAQALLMENKFDNHTAKIIARASYESGARWVISKLSGSPTVASEGEGEANMRADECTCKTVTEIWSCDKRCTIHKNATRA